MFSAAEIRSIDQPCIDAEQGGSNASLCLGLGGSPGTGMFLLHGLLSPHVKDCAGGQERCGSLRGASLPEGQPCTLSYECRGQAVFAFCSADDHRSHITNGFRVEPALFLPVRLSTAIGIAQYSVSSTIFNSSQELQLSLYHSKTDSPRLCWLIVPAYAGL